MAPFALPAERAAMGIVTLMTTDTGFGQFHGLFRLARVTGIAIEPLMRAIQDEARLFVVLKTPERPAVGVVTGTAFRAEAFLVHVYGLMAACALQRGVLVLGGQMACLARRRRMQADQREAGQVVVKKYLLPPSGFIVTAAAFLALLAFMNVVLPVT